MRLPRVMMAAQAASARDADGRKRKCQAESRSLWRWPSLHRLAATRTSYGLLHGELEPAWGLCLLPVRCGALPPTARLTRLARLLAFPGRAAGASSLNLSLKRTAA